MDARALVSTNVLSLTCRRLLPNPDGLRPCQVQRNPVQDPLVGLLLGESWVLRRVIPMSGTSSFILTSPFKALLPPFITMGVLWLVQGLYILFLSFYHISLHI